MSYQILSYGMKVGLAFLLLTVAAHRAGATEPIGHASHGRTDYANYCSPCHGIGGDGRGPMAKLLDPKPADHRNAGHMKTLSDDYLFRLIRDGGPAFGKSKMMAAWGEVLSDQQIRNLIAYLRTLGE